MKILVIGGAGFIGSHTISGLLKEYGGEGVEILGIDDFSEGSNVNEKLGIDRYINCKIQDEQALGNAFNIFNPDIVFNFVSNTSVPDSIINPKLDLPAIYGMINILELCRANRTRRFIHASSGFVYGNNTDFPSHELSPKDLFSPYAIAKSTCEDYIQFYSRYYKLDCVVLRYGTVYGEGQYKGALHDYVSCLIKNKPVNVWGDGLKTRDYVYVGDVIRANMLAIATRSRLSNIVNIGSGVETTLNKVIELIIAELNRKGFAKYPRINHLPDRGGELHRFFMSNLRAREFIGWKPTTEIGVGIHRMVKEYCERYRMGGL